MRRVEVAQGELSPVWCRHAREGIPWRMYPGVGAEVRRVRLCVCGRTFAARLAQTGRRHFDELAVRALRRAFAV